MSLGLAGAPYGFNYVAADKQSGLFVAASIYDITSGSPVFVTQVGMFELLQGSYVGVFTPSNGKAYSIVTLVYTDAGFTIVDPDRAPGTETLQTYNFPSSGGSSSEVIFQSNLKLQAIIEALKVSGQVETKDLILGTILPMRADGTSQNNFNLKATATLVQSLEDTVSSSETLQATVKLKQNIASC